MYSSSQFDGNAAFSGGGFMPSQATQTTTSDTSFSAKNRDTQPLLPLTVKQISEALISNDDKSDFLIDGIDVKNVTLVGMMVSKIERVTDISFILDDGTGRIECHKWVEAADTKDMERILGGMYVRVHGQLKSFQDKVQVSTFSIRPVTDFNEIAYHFTECIYVHSYNTRSRKVQGGVSTQSHSTNPVINTPFKGFETGPPNQFSGQHAGDGLKGIDKMIKDYLQQPSCLTRVKGVHREELAQQLNIPLDKIMESISFLEDEGMIYSTVDDCHYKSTGNG
ncbi:replication protein A 32 kDa subunit A-like [Malania oleifera]|uniref:replication protein A 32 kDa subunit A-like n=1 Tax=Malania oleifera TaxID=397392 RepID=UPI0025AEB024|nr:replication protein A 32 kDa subunit A-like [Malania oleifera]XP_057980377.1 replication protein A 32 kDa subunit A-like [Malania oleifera]